MFNPRNCHVLSLRIEFAAAGACLRSMRTALEPRRPVSGWHCPAWPRQYMIRVESSG